MSGEPARWAATWYMRRRHVFEDQRTGSGGEVRAICSMYVLVYPNGRVKTRGADVPLADGPEVMALPPCAHCLRLVNRPCTVLHGGFAKLYGGGR